MNDFLIGVLRGVDVVTPVKGLNAGLECAGVNNGVPGLDLKLESDDLPEGQAGLERKGLKMEFQLTNLNQMICQENQTQT